MPSKPQLLQRQLLLQVQALAQVQQVQLVLLVLRVLPVQQLVPALQARVVLRVLPVQQLQQVTTTTVNLPAQCSTYVSNTDATRSATYSGVGSSTCDSPTPFGSNPAWVRFSGAAGTQLATTVVNSSLCSTSATGWYSGVMPSSAGTTNNGTVCYNWTGLSCWQSNIISVTNCNGYYVFLLPATPNCSYRYCTS
ncbi:unnamed protein product [Rotaria socialis]